MYLSRPVLVLPLERRDTVRMESLKLSGGENEEQHKESERGYGRKIAAIFDISRNRRYDTGMTFLNNETQGMKPCKKRREKARV